MDDQLLENIIEVAELFINDQISEDEVYSLCYQGLVDEKLVLEAIDYILNSENDEDELEEGIISSVVTAPYKLAKGTFAAAKYAYNAPKNIKDWHERAMASGNESLKTFDKLKRSNDSVLRNSRTLKILNKKPVNELSPEDLQLAKSAKNKLERSKDIYNRINKESHFNPTNALYAKSVQNLSSAGKKISNIGQNLSSGIQGKLDSARSLVDIIRKKNK